MLGAARYQVLGDVYLIMLTMRTQEHEQLLGLAAGADDYIFKGATPDAILERLAAARREPNGDGHEAEPGARLTSFRGDDR